MAKPRFEPNQSIHASFYMIEHGINALNPDEQDGKGRISIILWGLAQDVIEEDNSPPLLGSDGQGPHAQKDHHHRGGRQGNKKNRHHNNTTTKITPTTTSSLYWSI